MNNPVKRKSVRINNAIRLQIFLGLTISLVTLVLFISCQDKSEKRSFSETKGFDTPVQNQEIKLPEMPANHGTDAAGGDALPPGHPSLDGQPSADAPAGAMPAGHPPMTGEAAAAGTPSGPLKWQLPKGWTATAGSGMYYAIVRTSKEEKANEIGVLSLPGEAGGLQANAVRWAGQLGIQTSEDKIGDFLAKSAKIKSKGNMAVTILDFSSMVQADDATSMLVAIAKPADDSYFIKMTGRKADLVKHKQDFTQFCKSLVFE